MALSRAAQFAFWSALGLASIGGGLGGGGCRRGSTVLGLDGGPKRSARGNVGDADLAGADLLTGVVDPWTWARARGASDRDRAIENIGPYEPLDRTRPGSPLVNTNGHYWTVLVGIAWDRDVDIHFDHYPVDLDADGKPDTLLTRHVHARGGILAQPELFGLVRTPDDPRGRVGRISRSTGVLGLREALTADGQPTGHIGMTCFLCHGGRDADGRIILGLPGAAFDYGLLLATASVLSDTNLGAAAERRARGFPDGATVRSRLLLGGPGRQDLTGEFGLDVTVPGTHAAHYRGTGRVRQGTTGIVNPISVPGILWTDGVDLQNWSGSEVASPRWLRRVAELSGAALDQPLRLLGLPPANLDDPHGSAAARRALLLDLRNLGTLGLQQDSFPGLLWADAIYGHADLAPADLVAIPAMYSAAPIRRLLEQERRILESLPPKTPTAIATGAANGRGEAAAISRGRDLFMNRLVGTIANRQLLKESPRLYAAAKLGGTARLPILAPIDEALRPTFAVRCADCHSASPGGPPLSIADTPPPGGRCSHCHRAHAPFELGGARSEVAVPVTPSADSEPGRRLPLASLHVPAAAPSEVAFCGGCHRRHRPFAPVAYSSGLLLPFDADGDGRAQDDEAEDARAGGIGTEALLAFDVPRPQRPPGGFALDLPFLSRLHSLGPIGTARVGAGWVRVAPLRGLRATAPYLHNGSVPTLAALLEPEASRPRSFPLGPAGFVMDTRLPGNRNIGHQFGTRLTPGEKRDLIAFLESL